MGKAVKLANLPNAPVFSASRTTSQSLTSGAWNKVQCATEYPPSSDYLDAVVKGDQAQMQAYIDACLAVKAKYPKPSDQ